MKHKILATQIAVETIAVGGFSYILLYISPLAIVGIITTVTSLGFKVWGQPAQLLSMYRRKSSEGIPWVTHAIATVSYISWCVYGLRTDNWVIVASQSLGVVGSFLTVHLIFQYRNRPRVKHGVLFWIWNNKDSRWQKVTFFDYMNAREQYIDIAGPIRYGTLPWYWAMRYNGGFLQGTVTDANVPDNPCLQEIFDGIIRFCEALRKEEGTWTTRTWNSPSLSSLNADAK